jgi:hypothetical protein
VRQSVSDARWRRQSAPVAAALARTATCPARCTPTNGTYHLVQQVKVSVREVLTGESSKLWTLRSNSTNMVGDGAYSFLVGYECGRDINAGRDQTCSSVGAGADPGSGPFLEAHGSSYLYRYFSLTPAVKEYPTPDELMGVATCQRGVTLFEIADDQIVAGRLYLEDVERDAGGIEQAVADLSGRRPRSTHE